MGKNNKYSHKKENFFILTKINLIETIIIIKLYRIEYYFCFLE